MSENEFQPTYKDWGEIRSSIDSALEPTVKAKVVAVLKEVIPKGMEPGRGISGRKRWTDQKQKAFRNRLGTTAHWTRYCEVRDELRRNHREWNNWEFAVVAAEQFTPAKINRYEQENRSRGNMAHPGVKLRAGTATQATLPAADTFQQETMSPRDVLLWVSKHMGTAIPEPQDCPNAECYGALLNAISAPGDFWKSFYMLAKKDDGEKDDPLADDGRKNLEFVDRQIEQFATDSPELVGKKHKDFTDNMWQEAGQIVSGAVESQKET